MAQLTVRRNHTRSLKDIEADITSALEEGKPHLNAAAERARRIGTCLMEAKAMLPAHDGLLPIPDLSAASEPITLEMAGGMPVPTDTLQAVHVGNTLLMEPLPAPRPIRFPAAKFSGEYAGGMPLPDF
ncbi:MAG TPA: hypothetical protein VFR68_15105 [Candidatus Dormibacteraeota bacterium]|nr:hypothetical protein [Candidatus Dormibacteraeota bacterium]